MRKIVLLAAVTAAAFAALPAAAMTPGQSNCPAQVAPANVGAMLVEEMLTYKEGQETNVPLTEAIKQVNDTCVRREKVSVAQQDNYTRYVIARLSHDELARQFVTMKVPVAVLERVFEIGPGRRNPTPDQVTEAQFNTLVVELDKVGVAVDKLPERALGMMGAYVTVASEMYRDQALVR